MIRFLFVIFIFLLAALAPGQALRQQGTSTHPICFLMVSSTDHVAAVTGLTPTVTISKDGGAFASPVGAVSEIGNGWYALAGNATDRNTLGAFLLHATGTGADPADVRLEIVAYDPFDSAGLGLSRLDAAMSSRAPAATALDKTTWTDAKAGYLDAAMSSRLAGAGYTAPDNAGIAAAAASAASADTKATAILADTAAMDTADELRTLLTGGTAALSTLTAQATWEYATRTLTAPTNISIPSAADNAAAVWGAGSREITGGVLPWQASWDAEAQSEAADALVAFFTSAAALVDLVWDEAQAGHAGAGTFGSYLNAAVSSRSSHSAADAATAVWGAGSRTLSGFGTLINDIWEATTRTLTQSAGGATAEEVWTYPGRTAEASNMVDLTGLTELVTAVKGVTDKLATMLEAVGANWQYTQEALAEGPAASGSGTATVENQQKIIRLIQSR
jgi:hypothetical protein